MSDNEWEPDPDPRPARGRPGRGSFVPWRRAARQEFIVIGLGRFGYSVARALVEYGYDVLAIDQDADQVQRASRHLPNVLQLDATNESALRQVGLDQFDVGLVSIGTNFEANLLATVILLKHDVPRVITKARTRTQKLILERVGTHEVVLPEHEAGRRMARKLAHSHIVDYLELSPDVDVVEIEAPASLHHVPLADCELRQRYNLSVIAIRRGDETIVNPSARDTIAPDDILVMVGRIGDAEKMAEREEGA